MSMLELLEAKCVFFQCLTCNYPRMEEEKEKSSNKSWESFFKAKMNDEEFNKLSEFITTNYGIKMPAAKRVMLQSRLHKRLRELNITSYKEYSEYIFSQKGKEEIINMIDVVSTNKTDFYREPKHFEFLIETILPEYISRNDRGKKLKVWSAGCSSGEEVYTLSFVLSDFFAQHSGYDFSLLGTDISTRILKKAIDGIYEERKVEPVPMEVKKKYLLRSKDKEKKLVRIVPHLRAKAKFMRLNFMDEVYAVDEEFDIIFCRNVLIYFDRPTQEKVINNLSQKLKKGGYFFLGHSESINGLKVPLVQLKPTIFLKI